MSSRDFFSGRDPALEVILAEVWMVKGDYARAISLYRKSLELNSDNDNALSMIARMEAEGERDR